MGYAHVISGHPILGVLTPQQIELLCGISKEVVYDRHQLLGNEGIAPGAVNIMIFGYVKLFKTSSDGKELILGLPGPDDLFGLCCHPIFPAAAGCSARALTRTKVISVPHQAWSALLKEHPDTAHVVMHALMSSRERCITLASDLVFLNLEKRLAKLLHALSRWGRPSGDGAIELMPILSQAELASALGSTRVAVTRKLGTLVESGLIRRRGRRILIPDLAKLQANFEPSRTALHA